MNTKPTEELMKEHSAIQLMLEILSEACTRLESGGKVVVTDLEKMLEFLKEFADGCHHAKEERHLFPALERAGIPRERGPIGVMLAEHNLGRSHIRRMSSAISGLAAGDTRAKEEFVQNARAYVHLLTMHIEKENKVLFPMADVHLPLEVQQGLARDFEKLELEEIGAGKHEEFHQLLHELKGVYLQR